MPIPKSSLWWRDSNKTASGKTGAVQLIASPFVFGYSGALRSWHIALGALVVLLALFELWQDWDRKLEA